MCENVCSWERSFTYATDDTEAQKEEAELKVLSEGVYRLDMDTRYIGYGSMVVANG